MNKKLIEIIERNERISNLYNIGPVHRAEVETFIEDIIILVANQFQKAEFDRFIIYEGFINYPIIEAI